MSSSETSDHSQEEIKVYARDIGIDPDNEPELLCLAREAIFARLPPGWAESQDESGNPIFHNHYLQTSTNEHPCKVQYRKMVAQERERIQRAAAVGDSVSPLEKKKNEEANNIHTKPFVSGFLSLIGNKCDETASLTLLSSYDEDDGIISEKEDSGDTFSGDQAEMRKSKMLGKDHSADQSSDSPLQQLFGEFLMTDNSISCDSPLETDEKYGVDEESDAAKGPNDSFVEDNSGSLDHEHIQCTDAVFDPRANKKEELIKKPGCVFCSGFLSVFGSGQDESFSFTPSSRDDNSIFEKGDSRSSDADLMEHPLMQDKDKSADQSTDSWEQQLMAWSLNSSAGSDCRLTIDVKDETDLVKSLDESESGSPEKGRFCASGADKDKQVEDANKTCGPPSKFRGCDNCVYRDVKEGEDGENKAVERWEKSKLYLQDSSQVQYQYLSCQNEPGQHPLVIDSYSCQLDSGAKLNLVGEEPILNMDVLSECLDNSMCAERQLDAKENKVAKSQDVSRHDYPGKDILTPQVDQVQSTDEKKNEKAAELELINKSKIPGEFWDSDNSVSSDIRPEMGGKVEDDGIDNFMSQDETGHQPSYKQVQSKPVAQEYGHIQGTDDIEGFEDKREEEEEDSIKTLSEDLLVFSSDSFEAMDVKGEEGEEDSEATKSQDESGNESFGEAIDICPVIQVHEHIQCNAVSNSGAEQYNVEERPGKTTGDKTNSSGNSTESPKQPFVDCNACVCCDSKHAMQVKDREDNEKTGASKSNEAAGHSGAKAEDEPSKTPTDSAVAIRDGDLAEEITELEDQSHESPQQEVSERGLDSNDSVFEPEASSKSQDESGNESSVEDADSDIAAQECEHIQCSHTDGQSQAKHKEERTKEFLKPTALLADSPDSDDSVSCTDSQTETDEDTKSQGEPRRGAVGGSRVEQDKEKEAPINRTEDWTSFTRLRQESLRENEEEEMGLLELEMYTRTHHNKEKPTDFDRLKSGKRLSTNFCQEEEATQAKWKEEREMHTFQEEEKVEHLGHDHELQICQQKEELIKQEKEEVARLRREKDTRICRQKVELRREEEAEVEQLKRAKEIRLNARREELKKGEEEEEEWLKRKMDMKKCFFQEELNKAQKEAEQLMREKQMRIQLCLEMLRKEEELEAGQIKREKDIRIGQLKEELMKEEQEEVAQLKKETEKRIRRCLEELRREEDEKEKQLKQEKEMRMQLYLEELQREEEEEAEILKRDKNVRFYVSQEQQLREKEEEEEKLKKCIETSKNRLEEELRREDYIAEKMKRERAMITHLRQQEELKRLEEEDEQMTREKRTQLHQEELRREEEENEQLMSERDLRNSLLMDQLHSAEEVEVAWLRRDKEMRIRLYQEGLKREEEDEMESFKREQMTRMCLHQEVLRREEEKEVDQLQRERQTRMHVLQDELRRKDVNELEKLRREKAKRTHPLLKGVPEEERDQLKRQNAVTKTLQFSSEGKEGERMMKQDKAKHFNREKAKSWPRRKEPSTKKEAKGLFMRKGETQTMLYEDELISDDEGEGGLKRVNMRMSLRQGELRKEDEAERLKRERAKLRLRQKEHGEEAAEQSKRKKMKREKTKSWPRRKEHSIEKEAKGMFMKGMETQTMDHEEDLQSEDKEVECLEARTRTLLHGEERGMAGSLLIQESSTEEEAEGQFTKAMGTKTMLHGEEKEMIQSWLSQESSTEEEAEGQFTRAMGAKTMLHGEEKEMIQSWLSQESSTEEEAEGQFARAKEAKTMREDEKEGFLRREMRREEDELEKLTRTMLHEDEPRSEDEQLKRQMPLHLENLMRKEDEAEQFERMKAKSWPRRKEHSTKKEAKGLFMRESERKGGEELGNEDEKVEFLKREMRMPLRQEELKRKEGKAEKFKKEKANSWPRRKEHITKEEAKGLFMRETERGGEDLRNEGEQVEFLKMEMRMLLRHEKLKGNEDKAEIFKREKAKSWPCRKEHNTKENAKGLLMRELERQTMLCQDVLRSEDEEVGCLKTRMRMLLSEEELRGEEIEVEHLESEKTKSGICQEEHSTEEDERGLFVREMEKQTMIHEDELGDKEEEIWCSSGDEENGREHPRMKDRTCLHREGPRSMAEQVEGSMWENEKHLHQELRREDDEEEEKVDFLKRQKQRRICLFNEELRRDEEEEVEQLQSERDTRMRKYEEKLRRDEEIEADLLKRAKEQRICLLREELKVEEEEEAERLKRDKKKRMKFLHEEMQREEEERLKWENERTWLHQEEQNKHEEEEQFKRIEWKRTLYPEDLRKEEKAAGRFKREKEKRAPFQKEGRTREETAQVEQLRKEKDKRIGHLQKDLRREAEDHVHREKGKRTRQSQETLRKVEDKVVEQFKREKAKRMHYRQEELKREEDEEVEQFKIEKENRMGRLQDELKRETDELIDKLKAEKQKRMRLRQIDLWGEEEERRLKTEYKERLRALRQYLFVKRRDEETLLNKMFEQKVKLTESAWMERDEEQFQLRQDREATIRALCHALEEEREAEHDRLKAQRRQFFERLKAESEEELQSLRTRLQEGRAGNLKFLTPEQARLKSFDPGFCSTFHPMNGPGLESQHEILGAFRPPQKTNTTNFSAYTPTLTAPHPMNTTPIYTATHPSLSTPEPLFCHARSIVPVCPMITTSLRETYLANPTVGYCDQLSLNKFNEITVYRFQRQNAQWTPSLNVNTFYPSMK